MKIMDFLKTDFFSIIFTIFDDFTLNSHCDFTLTMCLLYNMMLSALTFELLNGLDFFKCIKLKCFFKSILLWNDASQPLQLISIIFSQVFLEFDLSFFRGCRPRFRRKETLSFILFFWYLLEEKWYFVPKIVLTYCKKKMF